ncbi:branched-chain amino acid ABC transporter permease [Candidatus Peregrinibacteria bacterium]|nr:branched-chain amino acid ABC transporter permease [Candidatus Peregrinibacteria bacterium]MBT3598850.1 branched-chain amino acid ABC transporter permease [Candidatus Peregrinibacteria bacterium]MBT4585760.1 branched-chain amino acid ABC transporter permease [Candidatus Peregrinibacteria bacterium]MBT6730812.1 branched-chain amino acid ABC transporter permease [Candidatus Peregrinibacteria bacterium]MBT7009052.1 branched-chain amino acid ABC transporter permease [Candidatus Peregrinibacteria
MQLVINAFIAGSLAALIAGGLAFVYGILGVFNLALGQIALIGGYTTWWLYQVHSVPLPVSIICGMAFGALVSWLIFEVFINPFYKRHRFLPLVTTIALSMILDAVILMVFRERPRSILPGVKEQISGFGITISPVQIVMICTTLVFLFLLAYFLHSTSFGRKIRAVTQNDIAASSLGIRSGLMHRIIFIISGVLAAAGGIYIGIDTSLTPVLAFSLTIKAYAAIIAGGKGNIWGAILCAYLISLLEQFAIGVHWFGTFYISAGYQQTVALLVIILFLLWKPNGLFVSSSRKA